MYRKINCKEGIDRTCKGVSTYTINKLNKNENITMEVLGKTCKVLDYSLDDIMEFEEEKGVGRNNNENLFKKSYITFVGLFIVTIVIGAIYTEC
ncbi:MAG: helix-turn-helix transcriptional regulator [Solobacterium sp.]|nr:helix-turn-helix transcriptional regulator [Solobacterium sp.]